MCCKILLNISKVGIDAHILRVCWKLQKLKYSQVADCLATSFGVAIYRKRVQTHTCTFDATLWSWTSLESLGNQCHIAERAVFFHCQNRNCESNQGLYAYLYEKNGT